MEKRTRYTPEFKSKVMMEVLREQTTVSQWKREFVEKAPLLFDRKTGKEDQPPVFPQMPTNLRIRER